MTSPLTQTSVFLRSFTPQVLLHGDAAFAGQGIVYETMQLAKVKDFANGGTIHIVVNNQVHPKHITSRSPHSPTARDTCSYTYLATLWLSVGGLHD